MVRRAASSSGGGAAVQPTPSTPSTPDATRLLEGGAAASPTNGAAAGRVSMLLRSALGGQPVPVELAVPAGGQLSADDVRAAAATATNGAAAGCDLVVHDGAARRCLSADTALALSAIARGNAAVTMAPRLQSGRVGMVRRAGPPPPRKLDASSLGELKAQLAALPPGAGVVTMQILVQPAPGQPPTTQQISLEPRAMLEMLEAGPGAALSAALAAGGPAGGGELAAELPELPGLAATPLLAAAAHPAAPVTAPRYGAPGAAAAPGHEAWGKRAVAAQEEAKLRERRKRDNIRTNRALELLRDKAAAKERRRERRRQAKLAREAGAGRAPPAERPPAERRGAFGFKKGFLLG